MSVYKEAMFIVNSLKKQSYQIYSDACDDQRLSLSLGDNYIKVNHTVFGSLKRVCLYDADNMQIQKVK